MIPVKFDYLAATSVEEALSAPDIAHLHIAEFATLNDNPDVIVMAKRCGLTVSLDPSWDDELIRQDAGFFEACAGVDIFLPNVEEGEALTGEKSAEAILRLDSGAAEGAARR